VRQTPRQKMEESGAISNRAAAVARWRLLSFAAVMIEWLGV